MTKTSIPPQNRRPLAVTMGEPAGIGPELVVRLWNDREALDLPPFVFVGASAALQAFDQNVSIQKVKAAKDSLDVFQHAIPVLEVPLKAPVIPGEINPANGAGTVAAIDKACGLALAGNAGAVVTAPIHKAALYEAGFTAPGHTEYLARCCDLPDEASVMMLTAKNLRVVPVTIHIALKDVPKQLTANKIIHAGITTAHDLKTRFGIAEPRLAVAGLNPHAGEEGAMGLEEATHIKPAIWALRDQGINVSDPLPADTLFHEEARTQYDAVLCMYHDQALIPVKTVDFWGGVNVTLGLPIIRTSPDHGTALSLAGTGKARTESMVAAIRLAAKMETEAK